MKHGKGTYTWSNGDRYEGEWVENFMEGQGEFTWSDGRKYIGQFKNSVKEGKGELYNAKGQQEYEGMWKAGKQDG